MKKLISCCSLLSVIALNGIGLGQESSQGYILSPLPYKENVLKPYISERTMILHYGKPHKGYVEPVNKLSQEKGLIGLSLEALMKKSAEDNLPEPFSRRS